MKPRRTPTTWMLIGDEVAALLVALVFICSFFSYGLVRQDLSSTIAYVSCGLLGIWGVLSWMTHRWEGRESAVVYTSITVIFLITCSTLWHLIPVPTDWLGNTLAAPAIRGFEELGITPNFMALALSPEAGWQVFHQWVASLCFFAGIVILAKRRRGSIYLIGILLTFCITESLLGVVQRYGGNLFRSGGSVYNPNHHATAVICGLPLLIATIFNWERLDERSSHSIWTGKNPKILVFLLILPLLAAWTGAFSRGSLMAGSIVLISWGIYEILGRRLSIRKRLALITTAGSFLAVFAYLLMTSNAFQDRVMRDDLSEGNGRLQLWKAASSAFQDQWLIGFGPGGSEPIINRFAQMPLTQNPVHVHNDWLQMIVEHGALGIIPVLIALAFLLTAVVQRERRREKYDFEDGLLRRAALAGVLIIALHSFVDFPARVPIVGLQVLILIALTLFRGSQLATRFTLETYDEVQSK